MPRNTVILLEGGEGRELVKRKCREAGVKINTIEKLVDAELSQQGKLRKRGLYDEFDHIFDEDIPEG